MNDLITNPRDRMANLYEIRLTLNGEKRVFHLRVKRGMEKAFLAAAASKKEFMLETYGEVVHRGWEDADDPAQTSS